MESNIPAPRAFTMGLNGYLYKYVLKTPVSFITPTLLLLLLLGLTSDYVVYIMARYKKELAKGEEHPTLVSSKWAGHAVFTSGLTVVIAYLVLWLVHVPLFSDSGLTNAIGVGMSVILANTLLLALLHRYGRKILNVKNGSHNINPPGHRITSRIGDNSTGHKSAYIAVFIVVTLFSLYVYYITPAGINIIDLIPKSSNILAAEAVNSSFGGDFFDRSYIIVQFQSPLEYANGSYNIGEMRTLSSIENTTLQTQGVKCVFGPSRPYGTYVSPELSGFSGNASQEYMAQMNSFIGTNTSYAEIVFETSSLAWSSHALTVVNNLETNLNHNKEAGYSYNIGGLSEGFSNALTVTSSSFSELVPVLIIVIFFILLMQLGSIPTPIRLILMVLAAVVIGLVLSYVVIHYIEKFPIIIFTPLFAFITLLAVGLDYDIFMITRVREEVMKGTGEVEAIKTSVRENGAVIMTLGAVLAVTFGSLYFSTLGIVQEIGLALAVGVLVDTFIMWPFFVPAVMSFMKKYNWWPSKIGKS